MELKATNATLYFEKQKSARLDKVACKLRRKKRNSEFPSHIEIEFAKSFENSELKPFDQVFDEIMHEPVRRIRRQIKWWEVQLFIILKKNNFNFRLKERQRLKSTPFLHIQGSGRNYFEKQPVKIKI